MSIAQFTIESAHCYGLSMYPGYGNEPYFSPIRVERVVPLGNGLLEVEYLNAGYAEGVQQMKKKYRVHRRGERNLVLDELHVPERTAIIEAISASWIMSRAAWFVGRLPELQ